VSSIEETEQSTVSVQKTTGRARTVIVSQAAGHQVASITTVVARRLRTKRGPRLITAGSTQLEPETRAHLEQVVLAAVDRITDALGAGQPAYELSILGLAATSIHDVALAISGHSLDTAVALAMLSAALGLPLREEVVSTGEVASADGDIRPVGGLPAKLQAACATAGVDVFLCPALNGDGSLSTMAPDAYREVAGAVATASARIRVLEIRDLGDLVRQATTPLARVQAALYASYFHSRAATSLPGARALVEDLEDHFWRCLEAGLYGGCTTEARRLLRLRLRAALDREVYPAGFGARLSALVDSVPPAIRRRRGFFPLVPAGQCFQIGCLARTAEQQDAMRLMCAAAGQLGVSARSTGAAPSTTAPAASMDVLVETTLAAISEENLTHETGLPADEARAAFVLPTVVIEDYDLFNETITAFHRALLRHTDSADAPARPDEALGLLERAFADAGGLAAAREESKFAIHGGMRRVLDVMTEQCKRELRFNRVHRVLKEALDPLDWDRQVDFMKALLERLRPRLPAELKNIEPSRLVRRKEELVRACVEGSDRFLSLMRTF
jgi:hypothetical protein